MHTKQFYFDNLADAEMSSSYPSILTPPMESPELFTPKYESMSDSPPYALQICNVMSPDSDCSEEYDCWLSVMEEPVDKFRFRYKSEMAGTHGSLNGRNSDRSRKQSYPTVKLHNFHSSAIIRCSLFQIGQSEPHAHRLVRKIGSDETDDPHDIEIGPEVGFKATFMNMGIIHTAKKYIIGELCRKYSILRREEIARQEGAPRALTPIEEDEVKAKACQEGNHINLNQVCLKFDAFRKEGNILIPICKPIFSGIINNLKSALTGDLKIVRMDHCTSPSRGGQEVFILVEKVTKKNVKIRFFELDEDCNEVWSDYGRFNDLDVHHQYAIVFKTPPYRQIDIEKQVKVFIELLRPSDGARSEAKDFAYTPCEITLGRKRPRASYSSFGSNNSSIELPAILPNSDFYVNSKDLEDALETGVDSEEFSKLCDQLLSTGNGIERIYIDGEVDYHSLNSLTLDGPLRAIDKNLAHPRIPYLTEEMVEDEITRRVETELVNFYKTVKQPQHPRINHMLTYLLDNPQYKSSDGNNALHLLIKNNSNQAFLIKLLATLLEHRLSQIVNIVNGAKKSALHIAVLVSNEQAIDLLLRANIDRTLQDSQGNTALHNAIMYEVPENIIKLLFKYKTDHSGYINLQNNNGNTALHLTIKMNNLAGTKILCKNGVDVDIRSNTNGYTPLHMAVADQQLDIVNYLLERDCNSLIEDYSERNVWNLSKVLIDPEKPITTVIYNRIEAHMKKIGVFEALIKEEVQPDDSSNMELDLNLVDESPRLQLSSALKLKYTNITCIPDECVNHLAPILNHSGMLEKLANELNFGHLIRTGMFRNDANPAKSFLDFFMANAESLLKLRDSLILLGEIEAVVFMDKIIENVD